MTQADIMKFLDNRPGIYYSARTINKHMDCNITSTIRSLNKIIKREEYNTRIIPSNEYGRGRPIMLYSARGNQNE